MIHKVLILGANGMLGSAMYNEFRSSKTIITYGLVRRNIRIYNKDPQIIIKDFDSSSILESIFSIYGRLKLSTVQSLPLPFTRG